MKKPKICADLKSWYAISCPVSGLRFDQRTLEFLDSDRDGFIRSPEVKAALEFLESKGVTLEDLYNPSASDEAKLSEIIEREAALDKEQPSPEELSAMAEWEKCGTTPEISAYGRDTAAAEAALSAVEKIVDGFFAPPDDMPLVIDGPEAELPLRDKLNPRYADIIADFAEKCIVPVFGPEKRSINRQEWKTVKEKLCAYRKWIRSKPVMCADAKSILAQEEKLIRFKLHLGEFLDNYVSMKKIYDGSGEAIFQTGVLRLDGREMSLCFHVDSEASHSALVAKSNCCVLYLKLTRPSEGAERTVCAVVTAGRVASLYSGRNGVFYDRDGKDWLAVVTKVVESQVSLVEAFWSPWRKIGEGVASAVKKFIGDKQTKSVTSAESAVKNAQDGGGGAAMASSVAAIGIGIGMMGAAAASLMAAVSQMVWWQLLVGVAAVVLVVSLPSVVLTWFKLRRRDLGAILNASGWAINRPMRFSMRRADDFTKCRKWFG